MSHPVWVRGLKLFWQNGQKQAVWSHPVWVRGLKHSLPHGQRVRQECRTLCGCVD